MAPAQILDRVIEAIAEIDLACCTQLNGIQHGLMNVKLEFQSKAKAQTGKTLTEEPLIAWLIHRKLTTPTSLTQREVRYPNIAGRRNKCDLVFPVFGSGKMWLEVKLAWKGWFNCVGPADLSNGNYLPYLQGKHHDHSLRGDFEKLAGASLPAGDHRAVCLVGFDSAGKPMDSDVTAEFQRAKTLYPWQAGPEKHWLDRRSPHFRINVWTWFALPGYVAFPAAT